MGFIEEEDQLRLVPVANFWHFFVKLRQHPEQERSVELRRRHQFIGGKNVDDAMALGIGLQQVLMVKGRLSEEFVAALLLQGHKAALNRTDAGRGDISVLSLEILGCLAHMLKHGLKIFQVEEKKALVIGDL